MRIISGKNKGRHIQAPANLPVRPTTDRAKESLFNILNNRFDFSSNKVLDLFCGTGNISFEFASRGCPEITAVDIESVCTSFVSKIADELEFPIITQNSDFIHFLNLTRGKWDIIFADPPYTFASTAEIPQLIFDKGLLEYEGQLIIEHDKHLDLTGHPNFIEQRKYGKVNFSFFQ